jgi:hypothetical protein
LCSCRCLCRQVDTFKEYTDIKRKLLSRTPALRGSLATTARAELPRPLGPGEVPQAQVHARADDTPFVGDDL